MKLKNIIIIIVTIVVLGVLGYFGYKLLTKEPTVEVPLANYDEALNLENTSSYRYTYDILYDKYDTNTFCQFDNCDRKAATIKTETKDIQILDVYENKYFFYKDNGKIKVYDHRVGKTYIINVKGDSEIYLFGVDEEDDTFYGVIVDDNGFRYYFSLEKNKGVYAEKYKDLYFVSKNYLSASILSHT